MPVSITAEMTAPYPTIAGIKHVSRRSVSMIRGCFHLETDITRALRIREGRVRRARLANGLLNDSSICAWLPAAISLWMCMSVPPGRPKVLTRPLGGQ